MAGVDLTDSSSAAGADDFDPITGNPTSQQVTVATVTVTGAPRGWKERERDVTGDHVTWADSPYIVTLKASDKRAGAEQAGNKLEKKTAVKTISSWTMSVHQIPEWHSVNCRNRADYTHDQKCGFL